MTSSDSLERINPDTLELNEATGDQSLQLHLQRYHYAGKHLVPGPVADVACGVGYGSYLLATHYTKNTSITAIDNDADAIAIAHEKYSHPAIHFLHTDAFTFSSPVMFSNIVSLETIEHLSDPVAFVRHMTAQLTPGGRFIASVPVTPSMDANPYHLQDFTVASFRKMMRNAGLKEVDHFIQVQPYNPFAIAGRKEVRSKDLRKNIAGYYLQHPGKLLLRIRSLIVDGFRNKYLVVVFEKSA